MIRRDVRNIGMQVRYIAGPRKGRVTTVTGFRGDHLPGVPNVTLTDGNSVPASVLERIKIKKGDKYGKD